MATFTLAGPNQIRGDQLASEINTACSLSLSVEDVRHVGASSVEIRDELLGAVTEAAVQVVVDAHTPDPTEVRLIPKAEWMNRLVRATQRAIRKSADDEVQDGVEEMRMRSIIDLDHPLVTYYVDLLRTKGLITEAEKTTLLTPNPIE